MRRSTSISLVCLAFIAASGLLIRFGTGISNVTWIGLNRLSRTTYGSYVTDLPVCAHLRSHYLQLALYRDANLALPPNAPGRIIFFGDSITQNWGGFPSEFFPGKSYLNRGIGGQHTGQMIWRFHQDVVELHPRAVVILGGTNDITLHHDLEFKTEKNINTMVMMAQHHGIRVVLCSIPPLSWPEPEEDRYRANQVDGLNAWLRRYAMQHHVSFVDYYSALAGPSKHMDSSITSDGVHPNGAGYAIMRPLAQQAIDALPKP